MIDDFALIIKMLFINFRIDEIFHDLQSCQSSFGTYLGRIEELQDLKYFIDHHLKSTDEELILRGMFDIFPNTYEEEKFAR